MTDRLDSIALEVLRTRLAAVADEGALTVQRTACSPVIAESRDNACALLDAKGGLAAGGGAVAYNFGVCAHAVRNTIALHGSALAPGDVFIANDPHNGGGLHAQDVVVHRPVFLGDTLVAWIANVGHMADMGGMAFGSWAPQATDCYQEALRLPSVRLYKGGEEQGEIWSVILNNIRVPAMVEMDLRSLVAGCQAAHDAILAIAEPMTAAGFIGGLKQLHDLALTEMRRRISRLEDGEYLFKTWTEWNEERFLVPCRLLIDRERMLFDFEGAAPQSTHFFNSKHQIIKSLVVSDVTDVIAHDIPLNEGVFEAIDVWCPAGSVVDAAIPAPIASAHFDVAMNASMAAQQCVMMAIAASSPDAPGRHLLSGPVSPSCMGLHTWSYATPEIPSDGWLMIEGSLAGGSAGHDRDGYDHFSFMVARQPIIEAIDVELFEQRYPVLVTRKGVRPGASGSGLFRAGAGCEMRYRPHGAAQWTGVMLGMRERVPLAGFAGGYPGANTRFLLHTADGRSRRVSAHESGVVVADGDEFEFQLGSGGGFGDPVERDPAHVAADVRDGRLAAADAARVYGVVLGKNGTANLGATEVHRQRLLKERLGRARGPAKPSAHIAAPAMAGLPLYIGVEQRGDLAVASASGAVLARAPDHWMDGCPILIEAVNEDAICLAYLDPSTGRTLLVDVVPNGEEGSMRSTPRRWRIAADLKHVSSHFSRLGTY